MSPNVCQCDQCCLEGVLRVARGCLEGVCGVPVGVSGECLEGVRKMSGRCPESGVSGVFLEGV